MATDCEMCSWILTYRRTNLTSMVRRALVDAEIQHRWRQHGEAKPS